MPRKPFANIGDLSWLETHDLTKITLIGGITLYFGTGEVLLGTQLYTAAILKSGNLRQTLTRAADRVSFSVQNVDRQLGTTVNTIQSNLVGARVEFMRAARTLSPTVFGGSQPFSAVTLMVGEIADAKVTQDEVDISVLSDLAPGSSYVGSRTVESLAGVRVRGDIRAPILGIGPGDTIGGYHPQDNNFSDERRHYPDPIGGRHRMMGGLLDYGYAIY